jgi:hypothetical protein
LAQKLIRLIQINFKGPVLIPTHQNTKDHRIPSSGREQNNLTQADQKCSSSLKLQRPHEVDTNDAHTHLRHTC